jgi:hypothetical protein
LIDDAGEMNGFLKCKEQSFDPSLKVEDGCLHISEGQLRVRWDVLARYAVQKKVWGHMEDEEAPISTDSRTDGMRKATKRGH